MIASYTGVLPPLYYGIGFYPENLSASCTFVVLGCVWSVWGAWTLVHQHPVKDRTPKMRVYVLCAWTAGGIGSTGCVWV